MKAWWIEKCIKMSCHCVKKIAFGTIILSPPQSKVNYWISAQPNLREHALVISNLDRLFKAMQWCAIWIMWTIEKEN
jgi:hypothetical protein